MGPKLGSVCDAPAGTTPNRVSSARRLVGDSLDIIKGVVVGGCVLSKEEIPNNEGLGVGVPVIFARPISPRFLYITPPTLTEVVVAKAAMATTVMVIWVAIDIPTAAVAALAIVPAPVAADAPADEAAWAAID